ncbi:hypothetical protein E2C01_078453 [Portunus trituberculatus]|uniref:Uncharacterized protein n=1 Tax=Portunus trituberculatus TaxID=210409 RepID=A0A5B7IQ92_PORTR|nr:hypothetical protein [Portunus trituberculatus]
MALTSPLPPLPNTNTNPLPFLLPFYSLFHHLHPRLSPPMISLSTSLFPLQSLPSPFSPLTFLFTLLPFHLCAYLSLPVLAQVFPGIKYR